MSRRRSTVSRWKSTALAAVLCVAATTATEPATQRQLVDRDGVAFSTPEAFCAIHCKPWRRRNRELAQCTRELCPQHFADTRELLEQANSYGFDETKVVSKINVLTCGSVGDSSHISFHIDADSSNDAAEQQLVFGGFYEAFFRAFDAMVASDNATVEACQLQWLQTELLPTASTSETTSTTLPKPMLVKFHRDTDQRACFTSIKTLWTDDDESFTPFLSHQDTNGASASVLLLHITDDVATEINALDCVSSVVQLPVILKMLPFARSAFQLRNRVASTTPAMRIRVIKGANPQDVLTRLQSKLTAIDGATNVFALPDRADLFPRSFFVSALPHLELWAHAVALAVADDEVEWVDERHEITHQTLRTNAYQMKPTHRRLDTYIDNLVGVKQAQDLGILGDGVIVGITDSGLYINHDQFDQTQRDIYKTSNMDARKVVYYNPWADQYDQSADVVCGHGTHVSGILAGSSYSKQASDIGVAPNSRIAFMDIGTQDSTCLGEKGCAVQLMTPAQASQLLQSQIDVGAKIFSFSWGTEGSDYSVQARQLDEYVYNNPEILIVVAAGNSGENSVTGQGTISSPSGAKNVISVGASLNSADSFENNGCPSMYNPGSVASFSSAGPTSDGRMKPDVVAPGMILVSSKSERPTSTVKSKDTCELQGTSQATPVVTGMAVLLSQWLRDGWWKSGKMDKNYGMKTIPAALLKALIIHSGDSLQRRLARVETQFTSCTSISNTAYKLSYPDVYQGYGKPNMSNIADFSSQSTPTLYFLPNSTEGSQPSVADGKEMRISFTVPRGVDLRATIVWTDPPGTVYATTQLQHDLDLSVQIRNSTKVFYPLTADNSTKRDSKNNIEMVVVTYQQLLSALADEGTQSKLVGADGSIIVEAIIYGRSVLQAKAQTFAFVASSSVIGSTTGSAGIDGTSGAATNRSDSFWTPWTIGGIGAGALVLLALVAMSVRCCTSKKHRHAPGSRPGDAAYHNHTTPAAAGRRHGGVETCPYCAYASNDPVVMVNHVENMHNGINAPVIPGPGAGFGLPVVDAMQGYPPMYTAPHPSAYPGGIPLGHHVPNARPDERCPYCSFSSADPVILVNHVEHVHGEQRFI